jgi:hypothetical protein
MAGLTLSEIEDRAKQMIQAACPDSLMEVECLTTDRETGRVFVVLRCRMHDDSTSQAKTRRT